MRKHIALYLLCIVTSVVVTYSCVTLIGPDGEELEGLSVAATAVVLRGMADDVELWDVNKNGIIDDNERIALGFGVASRILMAMVAQSAEADPDR